MGLAVGHEADAVALGAERLTAGLPGFLGFLGFLSSGLGSVVVCSAGPGNPPTRLGGPSNRGLDIGLRVSIRNLMPDLLGGPVTGTSEPICGVFIRQMRSDQTRSREMQLSGFNGTEQFWMFSRSAGHGDSLVGHAFREVQH